MKFSSRNKIPKRPSPTLFTLAMYLYAACYGCFGQFAFAPVSLITVVNSHSYQVVITNNLAYVANGEDGIHIFDISNPAAPISLGSTNPGTPLYGGCYSIALNGDYAYMASGPDGLFVCDISDPSHPESVAQWAIGGGHGVSVARASNYLYLGDFSDGIRVFDISSPTNLVNVSSFTNFGGNIILYSHYAFDGTGSRLGVSIFDTSDPTNLVFLGNTLANNAGWAQSCLVRSNYLYVADQVNGFSIFDISNPARPLKLNQLYSFDQVNSITSWGNYAVLSILGGGVLILDVSNPTNVVELGQVDDNFIGSWSCATKGNYVYSANAGDGLQIYYVVPQLSLSLAPSNTISLSWLQLPFPANYALQQSSDLSLQQWHTITNQPNSVGLSNQVTLPMTFSASFFRLVVTP